MPKKMNVSDPAVMAALVEFYEVFEDGWDDVGIAAFFEEVWAVAVNGHFYVYDNTDYYLVELTFPYFELHWYPMPIPIYNGTEFNYDTTISSWE